MEAPLNGKLVFWYDTHNRGQPGNVASLELEGTPWHAEFLDWARGSGIDVDLASAVKVHEVDGKLFATVTMYETDAQGRKVLDGQNDFRKRTETLVLSSRPPAPLSREDLERAAVGAEG
ncbi:hypothetical protein [Sphaerisporangium aureirubrum]|uniref:Uncharacterized protein n=1 Tax=Sphaerisporangium aureirubrum TaxID=1544736 RepID=A0ABW1NCB5_9ACTN